MKTNVFFSIVFLSLVACNTKPSQDNGSATDSVSMSLVVDTSRVATDTTGMITNEELDDNYVVNFSYRGIHIFEPRAYEESDFTKKLMRTMEPLAGLFQKGNKYELKSCKIVKTNIFDEECSEIALIEPTLNVKGNCQYLIKGIEPLAKSVLDTVPAGFRVWANKSKAFRFNNVDYELKSEGKVLGVSGKGDEYFENIRNYRLYLTSGDKAQCIVEMKYFADTMTEIRWIGDLDGDGKPDFIISSPDHYEANRIMLFLSSMAEKDKFVKLVSITVDTYAC